MTTGTDTQPPAQKISMRYLLPLAAFLVLALVVDEEAETGLSVAGRPRLADERSF